MRAAAAPALSLPRAPPSAGRRIAGDRRLRSAAALSEADDVMARLVKQHGPLDERERRAGARPTPTGRCVRSIVGQQLSTKAARSIYGRVEELFGGRTPTPRELLDADPEQIRGRRASRARRWPTCATSPSTSRTASST